jgi:hypothetical protein
VAPVRDRSHGDSFVKEHPTHPFPTNKHTLLIRIILSSPLAMISGKRCFAHLFSLLL